MRHLLRRRCVNIWFVLKLQLISIDLTFFWNFSFSIVCHIDSWTYKLILLVALNSFWNQHVLHSLACSLSLFRHFISIVRLIMFAFSSLLHRHVFRLSLLKVRSLMLSLNVHGLMFFSEYCRHVLYFLLLLWNASDIICCLGTTSIINDRSKSFFEDLIQVFLCIVHWFFSLLRIKTWIVYFKL